MSRKFEHGYDELPEGLYLFDLPQPMTGFHHFISSWFFVDSSGRRILVDPGPAGTIPLLLDELSRVTDDVDIVLLTHIHLDHSGGIGQFCERYGRSVVVAHPRAIRHLTDPDKLWRSSCEILGEVADMYGAPVPLDAARLADPGGIPDIGVIDTPGHSAHHLSFIIPFRGETLFFVGEACGLYHQPHPASSAPYLRPATPQIFDCDAAQASIQKIEQVIRGDEILCYAHWGQSRNARGMVRMAREQLGEWRRSIFQMKNQPEDAIIDHLLSQDPLLAAYSDLPDDMRLRERIFIRNSVRGFLKFFGE